MTLHHREGEVSGPADGCAVDEGVDPVQLDRSARRKGCDHGRSAGRFRSDHTRARVTLGQVGEAAGDHAAPTHRGDQDVGGLAELLDDLLRHRALAGDGALVIEGRDEGGAGLVSFEGGRCGGLVVGVADDHEVDQPLTKGEDALALLAGSRRGHEDASLDAQSRTGEGDPLAVVAGAGGDDSRRAVRLFQLRDQVVRAADLVGPHRLQVFALQPDVGAGRCAEPFVELQRSAGGHARQALGGRVHGPGIDGHRVIVAPACARLPEPRPAGDRPVTGRRRRLVLRRSARQAPWGSTPLRSAGPRVRAGPGSAPPRRPCCGYGRSSARRRRRPRRAPAH